MQNISKYGQVQTQNVVLKKIRIPKKENAIQAKKE